MLIEVQLQQYSVYLLILSLGLGHHFRYDSAVDAVVTIARIDILSGSDLSFSCL